MRMLRATLLTLAVVGLVVVAHDNAEAKCSKKKEVDAGAGKTKMVPRVGKAERKFGGRVLTSSKRFPTYARSVGAYISKIRKQVKTKFWENKADKSWKIHFIAFFRRPHDDMEVSIKLWDISTGQKHMLSTFEQYVERCATSYASNMVLKRADFGVNKQLLITVEATGRKVIASGKIKILGEGEKYKGKVDFSDEADEPADDGDDDEAATEIAELPKEPDPDPEPLVDPEALDMNDPELDEAADLDPRTEMPEAPAKTKKSSRGCGCNSAGRGGSGGLLLLAVVAGLMWRRRRPRAS
jgi:MYXO-CTERM domain-containing protein